MPISDSNKSYFDDQVASADILNNGGTQAALIVGTTAVEVKVGAFRLEGRKTVTLYNNSNKTIYWGYNNTVTTSSGTPIQKKELVTWEAGDNQEIWIISDSSGNNVRVTEAG